MQSTTGPIESFRFSSDDLPPGDRSKAVRELQERGILPLEPLPACPEPPSDLHPNARLPAASI